ncbi:hypothetical protein BD324DRAFT_623064 [Kockovaella imperatae]|uniref:NAD(P)-binding protein n=1 Tax=Kockovaella imperatae TaxID=4999 RepID=A0A1Y1UI88_9TREE|nr:hypothetical protein BD324DRAFT_623064 [Kockovaella imperatae]ORX37732.1 hypothetical protein BD324DRAFT_623064 [Kockovaella imperatae]
MSSFKIENMFSVKAKTCIVTGAGSGIGKGMATALATNGAKVIVCGRREEQIKAAAEEMNTAAKESGMGGEVIAIRADVGNKKGCIEFFEQASKLIDKLDFLVNNAGFSANWKDVSPMGDAATLPAKLMTIDDVDWANMSLVHCAGPYYLTVQFIPYFQKSEDPSVCNITSLAASFLNMGCCEFSYAQSKAAETQLSRLMAGVLKPFNIRVNCVKPGLFPSGLTTFPGTEQLYPPMQQAAEKQIPRGAPGTWEQIAGTVLMMASPAGAYLNGAELKVDGGWELFTCARDV